MRTHMKRRAFTLEEKNPVIEAAEKEDNQSKLACQFGYNRITIIGILKEKDVILKAIGNGNEAKRARLSTGKQEKVEDAIVEWFKQVRSENVPVSGGLFKEKGLEIAGKLGVVDFSASDGWLQKCNHRFGIQFKAEHGEAGAVNLVSLVEWQHRILLDELAKLSPNDIFNADETGLFYKALPNKAMAFKRDKWDNEARLGLTDAWNELRVAREIENGLVLQDYLDLDNSVITGAAFSINEIVEKYADDEGEMDDDEIVIEEEEENDPPISSLDAMRALRTLRQYIEKNLSDPATLRHSDALDDALYENRQRKKKQSTITKYFIPIF